MARKNKRWEGSQTFGAVTRPDSTVDHTCSPIPTRTGHVCLTCGRAVRDVNNPAVIEARPRFDR